MNASQTILPKRTAGDRGCHRRKTTAQAERSRAAGAGEPAAAGRGRPVGRAEPPQSLPEAPPVAVSTVRMLRVDEGLYALRVGAIGGAPGEIAGMVVPMAQVSAPFAEDGNGVEIIASFPRKGPWLDKAGGTMILRSPARGGLVVVTVYGGAEQQGSELVLDLQRLDGPGRGAAGPPPPVPPPPL